MDGWQARPMAVFSAGFVCCLFLTWLNRLFARWLFGVGVLRGRDNGRGHFVATSRGRVHYVFFDKGDLDDDLQDCQQDARPSVSGTRVPLLTESPLSGAAFIVANCSNTPKPPRMGKAVEYGQIHGELVVIVHGFAGSNDAFVNDNRSGYATFLNRNGYSVLAPDLHGAGHSDGPDTAYSSELFVEQLAELCLIFGITRPFDLVGFSMGGSVATAFAYRYPHLVKRLILQSPHVVHVPLRLSLQIALRIPFFREVVGYLVLPFVGEVKGNPAALRACYRLLLTNLRGGGRWSSPGRGGSTKEMLEEIDKSGRRVHLLWGQQDSVVQFWQAERVKELASYCDLVTHPTADHMSFADGPEETRVFFRRALLEFLQTQPLELFC